MCSLLYTNLQNNTDGPFIYQDLKKVSIRIELMGWNKNAWVEKNRKIN